MTVLPKQSLPNLYSIVCLSRSFFIHCLSMNLWITSTKLKRFSFLYDFFEASPKLTQIPVLAVFFLLLLFFLIRTTLEELSPSNSCPPFLGDFLLFDLGVLFCYQFCFMPFCE